MTSSQTTTVEQTDGAPSQIADSVLMVRPAAFARNEVTRPTNKFQAETVYGDPEQIAENAVREFDDCVTALRWNGVKVHEFSGRTTRTLPDEIFPNNWITTHPDGMVVLYPMMAWNRRQERRRDILEQLQQQSDGFRIDKLIDLSPLENKGSFLEGTGSLVFDHAERLAYACFSPRTHVAALREFARRADYSIVAFNAADRDGQAIYHTNVMMSLGEGFALVCLDSIKAVDERFRVLTRLERTGREVIEIRTDQLRSFVGNVLQLKAGPKRIIALSAQAQAGMTDEQLEALSRHGKLVPVEVGTIENNGGGSVRCMLAELMLPRKAPPPKTD